MPSEYTHVGPWQSGKVGREAHPESPYSCRQLEPRLSPSLCLSPCAQEAPCLLHRCCCCSAADPILLGSVPALHVAATAVTGFLVFRPRLKRLFTGVPLAAQGRGDRTCVWNEWAWCLLRLLPSQNAPKNPPMEEPNQAPRLLRMGCSGLCGWFCCGSPRLDPTRAASLATTGGTKCPTYFEPLTRWGGSGHRRGQWLSLRFLPLLSCTLLITCPQASAATRLPQDKKGRCSSRGPHGLYPKTRAAWLLTE